MSIAIFFYFKLNWIFAPKKNCLILFIFLSSHGCCKETIRLSNLKVFPRFKKMPNFTFAFWNSTLKKIKFTFLLSIET